MRCCWRHRLLRCQSALDLVEVSSTRWCDVSDASLHLNKHHRRVRVELRDTITGSCNFETETAIEECTKALPKV